MTIEEAVVEKLQRLPESNRKKVLLLIDQWIEQHSTVTMEDLPRAVAVVQRTWSTLTLSQKTLRWVAEDKDLEYDLG